MRLRVFSRRRDPGYFAEVAERLGAAPGVRRLETNWRTGGVLVLHEDDPGPVLAFARERDLSDVAPPDTAPGMRRADLAFGMCRDRILSPWRPSAFGDGRVPGRAGADPGQRRRESLACLRPRAARQLAWIFLGLVGLGVYQTAMGRVLSPAASPLIYALSARRMAREGPGAGAGEWRDAPGVAGRPMLR